MAEYVEGWKSVNGKIYTNESDADQANKIYWSHHAVYNFVAKYRPTIMAGPDEVAEYIWRYWDDLKKMMAENGR